jgi:polar amino acid transport system substrate-binding protein
VGRHGSEADGLTFPAWPAVVVDWSATTVAPGTGAMSARWRMGIGYQFSGACEPGCKVPPWAHVNSIASVSESLEFVRNTLAPTGTLRVALNEANFLLVLAPATEGRGVAADLGRDLGARLGVPVAFIGYSDAGKVADAAAHDAWDVAFIGADAARSEVVFSPPYIGIDATFLVRADSPAADPDEVDRPGIRIAVADRSAYHLALKRIITQATLVPADGLPASEERFHRDGLDVLAGLRPHLVDVATRTPGGRVLAGAFMTVQQAIGVPRRRAAAAPAIAAFAREVVRSGLVASLVQRHQVRGVTVPEADSQP